MKDFIMEIGFLLFLIGCCLADSENLVIPLVLFVLGLVLILLGEKI